MEKIIMYRLQRFASRPLEFWPFHAHITADERAVRAARGCFYVGLAYAVEANSIRKGVPFFIAAAVLLLLFGKSSMKLDEASLAKDPNPAGNALVGDISGRNPDIPQTESSLSMTQFVDRMQNPVKTDDYAILPVASPTEAHQIWSGGSTSSIPQPRQQAQLTYAPR